VTRCFRLCGLGGAVFGGLLVASRSVECEVVSPVILSFF